MTFWKRLFGNSDEPKADATGTVVPTSDSANQSLGSSASLLAENNMGTRFRDKSYADSYWNARYLTRSVPFVIYNFPTLDAAREAIERLSFIFSASDTGDLISTEVVEFGCFDRDGKGEVIICGDMFSHALWSEAKDTLTAAGGTLHRDHEPEKTSEGANAPQRDDECSVEFVREEHDGPKTYRIHRGSSKSAAMTFLKARKVDRKLYYVVVETPDGNFGRDIDGIYTE